jgi:hypothetical protein
LAVDEVIVKFKGRVIFKQYIPKEHKCFGIKIYKLCDTAGYTYDMKVYLGKDSDSATEDMTATRVTVRSLVRRVEGVGHKLFMDNFFSSPALFDDLLIRKINSCGTVRHNRKGMPAELGPKLKLKRGDIRTKVRDDLTALFWKDKRDVLMLTNMHSAPEEGNYCDEYGNAMRPKIIENCSQHMGYVDKSDRMASSYFISRYVQVDEKTFFHLIDVTILNSCILSSSCGAKYLCRDFRLILIRNLVEEGDKNERPHPLMRGRPNPAIQNIALLELRQNEHWPAKGNKLHCRMCSVRGIAAQTIYQCVKCQVGLCVVPCFQDYHTKTSL